MYVQFLQFVRNLFYNTTSLIESTVKSNAFWYNSRIVFFRFSYKTYLCNLRRKSFFLILLLSITLVRVHITILKINSNNFTLSYCLMFLSRGKTNRHCYFIKFNIFSKPFSRMSLILIFEQVILEI